MINLRQNKITKLIPRKSLFYRTNFFSLVHYKNTVIQENTSKLLKTAFPKSRPQLQSTVLKIHYCVPKQTVITKKSKPQNLCMPIFLFF